MEPRKIAKLILKGAGAVVIPLGITYVILRGFFGFLAKLVGPTTTWLVTERLGLGGPLAQFAMDLVVVLALIAICFLAGILVSDRRVRKLFERIRKLLLLTVPGYPILDSLVSGMANAEGQSNNLVPVLAKFGDYSQIAFKIENVSDNHVALYLPGSPNPWSGSVVYAETERIQPLDMSMYQAVSLIKALGQGSKDLLRKTRMT